MVQHGKRADSIVKNMLLHSREGSGEHRPVDINALVEESLNLAYHGARAEKQGFNITLERVLRSGRRRGRSVSAGDHAGVAQPDLKRLLCRHQAQGGGRRTASSRRSRAATKNLGDSVEIRIRDNGTGIPPEVKEKMFNPFFTTKPAGEGTGLGLSMSHDIIVKQHGGTIEVETEPGAVHRIHHRAAAQRWQPLRKSGGTHVSLLILVVDDEPDVEVLFRQQFRRDLRARPLHDGICAIGAARRWSASPTASDPSLILILSDINMPGHERA